MVWFVAFLRGINVGGRVVVKQTLKDVFVSLGFSDFSTFKQSGNVIFQTQELDSQELIRNIEAKLQTTLGYPVAVFIRTIKQLKDMLDLDPFRDQIPEGTSFLVTFLPTAQTQLTYELPFIIPKSTAKVINACGTEVFSVTHCGGEGALPNPFIESKFKVKATTRNLNVIRGIVKKYG
ncbi:MAG: DUF1697 domain-containing protein [Candidatus Bathyarchaeia archaeon]|jgi:uncharacterized protein (DUF1697 family)